MRRLLVCVLVVMRMAASAQQGELIVPEQAFGEEEVKAIKLGESPVCFKVENLEISLKEELVRSCPEFRDQRSKLILKLKHQSLAGYHFTYQQTFNGIEVYGSHLKVNLSKDFRVVDAHALLANSEQWADIIASENGEQEVVYFNNIDARLATIQRESIEGIEVETVTLNDGETFYRDVTSRLLPARDTLMKVYVFNPDPLTSTGKAYGGELADNGDADSKALTEARLAMPVIGKYLGGEFWLENKHIKFVSQTNKNFEPAKSNTNVFDFTRSQPGFEQANIYYHINTLRDYFDSIGHTGLVNYKMDIDPRNDALGDNSEFVDGTGQLRFGTGGIDDAEDADIIIHEFGHAVSYWLNGNAKKNERKAVDEGLSDYLACSYSKAITETNWERFANWDGNTQNWEGRSCFSRKVYPVDIEQQVHADGEILSSALMQIENTIGREETHRILIESMYSYHMGMGFKGAADYLLKADSLLNKASHYGSICTALKDHGLVSICTDGILEPQNPTFLFSVNHQVFNRYGQVQMEFEVPFTGDVKLYNALGQLAASLWVDGQQKVQFGNVSQTGVYVVAVSAAGFTQSKKISR